MKRRLLTLAAVASPLLGLLWLQSIFVGRTLYISAPTDRYAFVTSASGRLIVYWSTGVLKPRTRAADHGVRAAPAGRRSVAHRGRSQWWVWFGAEAGTVLHGTLDSADVWTWGFNVPWIYLIAPTVAVTATSWRTRHGGRAGDLCPTCGYDLRATPDRCPECGSVPTASPTPSV